MEIGLKKRYYADVAVIGGGTAGVFAAIAAARTGANTILAEKNSILGGTMTVAGVNFPGLFFAWGKQIVDGPCWEAVKRTISLGGGVMPEIKFKPERHWYEQIVLNKFIYTAVLFQMCEEAGVRLICNSMVSDIKENEDNRYNIGSVVTLSGIITEVRNLVTKKGEMMRYVELEDLTGTIEVIVFPSLLRKYEALLQTDKIVAVSGNLDMADDTPPKLRLEGIRPLNEESNKKKSNAKLYIRLNKADILKQDEMKLLLKNTNGDIPVILRFSDTNETLLASRSMWIENSGYKEEKLKEIFGADNVRMVVKYE